MQTNFYSKNNDKYKWILLGISLILAALLVYFALNSDEELEKPEINEGLPVIVIDSFGADLDPKSELIEKELFGRKFELYTNSERYDGNLKLYMQDPFKENIGRVEPVLDSDIILNARGQSSLIYPKKQYTIRLKDLDGFQNPQEILGMAEHDKWVLNGMYSDKSMMRNELVYTMGRQVMDYAPDTRYVEVYFKTDEELDLKKHYAGIYLLTEKIERDPNRVDIAKNLSNENDTSYIMSRDKIKIGDEVIESNWHSLEEEYMIVPKDIIRMRTVYTVDYPSNKNLTESDKENMAKSLDDFEYALRGSNFSDKKKGYQAYIDVDSFIKFAMINEISKNIDGGEVSSYFHKDLGQKIKAGPVWDFDMSMGNTPSADVNDPAGFIMLETIWYERLFQDDFFVNRYKYLYKKYRNSIWSDENINLMIDRNIMELSPSIEANNKRWYPKDSVGNYLEEAEQVREFLLARLDWMDKNINLIKRIRENVVD